LLAELLEHNESSSVTKPTYASDISRLPFAFPFREEVAVPHPRSRPNRSILRSFIWKPHTEDITMASKNVPLEPQLKLSRLHIYKECKRVEGRAFAQLYPQFPWRNWPCADLFRRLEIPQSPIVRNTICQDQHHSIRLRISMDKYSVHTSTGLKRDQIIFLAIIFLIVMSIEEQEKSAKPITPEYYDVLTPTECEAFSHLLGKTPEGYW
jgi:hypothetical protein